MTDKDQSAIISDVLRSELFELTAYTVPSAEGMLKLDAMESPYILPEALQSELAARLSTVALNRYPDPNAVQLIQQLKKHLPITDNTDIILGNGSDELIQLLCMAVIDSPLAGKAKPMLLSVEPSFAMYKILATAVGIEYYGVALQENDFSLDASAILQAIEQHKPAVVFIAYPNNPTGNLFDANAIHEILQAAPGMVVIDEAYAPFTDSSFLTKIKEYPNLIVMRTVSKLGLAGIRLGYMVATTEWLQELNKLRLPYNINSLTQAAASFALEHYSVFQENADNIRQQRSKLLTALSKLNGISPYPSEANFILFKCEGKSADAIFAALKAQNILIKNLSASSPMLANHLRVTIGTAEENQKFVDALTAIAGS